MTRRGQSWALNRPFGCTARSEAVRLQDTQPLKRQLLSSLADMQASPWNSSHPSPPRSLCPQLGAKVGRCQRPSGLLLSSQLFLSKSRGESWSRGWEAIQPGPGL